MTHGIQPVDLPLIALAGWLNRQQQAAVDRPHKDCALPVRGA